MIPLFSGCRNQGRAEGRRRADLVPDQRRHSLVPIGLKLKPAAEPQERHLIEIPADELQADGKAGKRKSRWAGKGSVSP